MASITTSVEAFFLAQIDANVSLVFDDDPGHPLHDKFQLLTCSAIHLQSLFKHVE